MLNKRIKIDVAAGRTFVLKLVTTILEIAHG